VKKKNRFTFLSLKNEEKENECEGEEKKKKNGKMEKWNEEIKIKK